jgi:hypothetical protein
MFGRHDQVTETKVLSAENLLPLAPDERIGCLVKTIQAPANSAEGFFVLRVGPLPLARPPHAEVVLCDAPWRGVHCFGQNGPAATDEITA